MKNKFFMLTLVMILILSPSCAQIGQQENTKKPVAGVESSAFQLGDIENVKVIADKSNVNQGCTNNAPTLQSCPKGSSLDVVSKVEDWYAVKTKNNQIGFIPTKECKPYVNDKKSSNQPKNVATPQDANGVKTPTQNTNTGTLSADERKMVDLVNQARIQNKLAPLKIDTKVADCARLKAQDMIDNNYFSHNSPKYGDPFEMMKSFGIKFVQAGENIAGNQSVENAENALMNSPGHRRNILSPEFTHIGIGIKNGGTYGKMFSQMFISK